MPEVLSRYARASRDIFDLQRLELGELNLPALLCYEDKNSMWHGIETRLPFLDYLSVEHALSLPRAIKIHEGWTKYILRRAMDEVLPNDIVWRRDKRGFEAPDRIWLGRHEPIMAAQVRSSRLLRTLCKEQYLERGFPRLDMDARWRLYCVALWEEVMNVTA